MYSILKDRQMKAKQTAYFSEMIHSQLFCYEWTGFQVMRGLFKTEYTMLCTIDLH